MTLRKPDTDWWRYQARRVPGQLRLREAIAARPKSVQEQAAEILARPGAVSSTGMLNPRIVSREEARIVLQARRAAGLKPQAKVVSPGESYWNVVKASASTAVEAAQRAIPGQQQLERLTKEKGPIPAWEEMQWPTLKTPGLQKVGGEVASLFGGRDPGTREILRGVGEAVTPSQFGPKGAAELAFDPLNFLPVVGWGGAIGKGATLAGKAATRAGAKALKAVPQVARQLATEEGGFVRLGGGAEGVSAMGREAVAYGPDPNKVYRMRYRVVEMDDLIPSHTDAFAPNPAYPSELQPRLRDRGAARLSVQKMARDLVPEALVQDSQVLDRGPMIIGADRVVESGNGRIMALRLARASYPGRWEAYQQALRDALSQFGIDEAEFARMKNPVLVRERVSDVDRVRFAAESNQPAVAVYSPVENALQDAKRIRFESLIVPEETQSLDVTLRMQGNKPFIASFLETLPANERGSLVDALGDLNLLGVQRVKAAMFARTYPGEAGRRLTQIFFESREPLIRNVEEGMMASLPQVARAEDLVRTGQRVAGLSIGEDLAASLDMLARIRNRKMSAEQYLGQAQMFQRELTPFQEQLLLHLDGLARSPRRVREFLGAYADRVTASPHPQQRAMFAGRQLTKEDLFNATVRGQAEGALFATVPPGGATETLGRGLVAEEPRIPQAEVAPTKPVAPVAERLAGIRRDESPAINLVKAKLDTLIEETGRAGRNTKKRASLQKQVDNLIDELDQLRIKKGTQLSQEEVSANVYLRAVEARNASLKNVAEPRGGIEAKRQAEIGLGLRYKPPAKAIYNDRLYVQKHSVRDTFGNWSYEYRVVTGIRSKQAPRSEILGEYIPRTGDEFRLSEGHFADFQPTSEGNTLLGNMKAVDAQSAIPIRTYEQLRDFGAPVSRRAEAPGGVVRKEAVEDIAIAPSPAGLVVRQEPHPLGRKRPWYRVYVEGETSPISGNESRDVAMAHAQRGLEIRAAAQAATEEGGLPLKIGQYDVKVSPAPFQGRFIGMRSADNEFDIVVGAGDPALREVAGELDVTFIPYRIGGHEVSTATPSRELRGVLTPEEQRAVLQLIKREFPQAESIRGFGAPQEVTRLELPAAGPAARAAEEAAPAPGRTPRVRRTPPPQPGAPGAVSGEAAGVAPPSPAAELPGVQGARTQLEATQREVQQLLEATEARGGGAGKPPRRPLTATGGAEPLLPPPPSGPRIMGDLSDISETIDIVIRPDVWRTISNKPGLRSILGALNPSAVANSPAHQAVVGRAMLRDQAQQLAQVATAKLNSLGTQQQVFGRLTPDGLLAEGPLKGITVNTIRSNPSKYIKDMTPQMKEWVRAADDVERAKLAFLRENGIDVAELAFEEGAEYAGRRVFAKITQNGEMVDAGFVGAGPGRPGAKLAAEKHRIFKTAEEAIEQGYRYLPDDEALFLNVQGAYNRVADKKMADWLLLKVPWRTTAAPEELKVAAYAANQKLWRSRQLLAALNRAVRGERLPSSTIRSIEAAYPEQADALKTLVVKLQQPKPRTAAAVQRLTVQARGLIADAQIENAQAVRARARARERAMTTTFEEARIQAPAFAGKIFTGPEAKETARILRESMEPGFNRALGALNQFNAVGRYFQLAMDTSPMLIQLLYLAGAHPRVYAGAAKGFVRSLLDTTYQAKYLAKPENMAIIQKYPNLILTRGGTTEFTEAMARGGLLRKGPLKLAGKLLEPFQRGFEGALDVAGIDWAKALDHLGTDAAKRADLGQFINEFRGLTSSARLGVSLGMRQAETAVLLAPRYNRAIAALLFDTVHGGLRGELARRSLAQGVAAVVATGVVISIARGESEEEILQHLNPASPAFMTWKVGGQNVGPGSKLRSVIRLFALSAKDPSKLLDTSVGWGELEYMRNPIIKFGRGLSSPGVSKSWDLLTGKDFIGDPTRDGVLSFSKTVASAFMPIWTQTVAFEGGDIGGRVTRGVGEFLGLRAYPRNLLWEASEAWRGDLQSYRDIPTDDDLKLGQLSRTEYRKLNPTVDAKLFIVGHVTSLSSEPAVTEAVRLIRETGLSIEDIRGIAERKEDVRKSVEAGRVLKSNEVDKLIQLLEQGATEQAPVQREQVPVEWKREERERTPVQRKEREQVPVEAR